MDMKNKLHYFYALIALAILFQATGCEKTDSKNKNTNTTTVTDVDGNVYHTVTIGNQVWMRENLRVTHYRDGSVIPNVTDGTEWWNLASAAWCNYENNAANGNTYGKLYNWHAVNSGQLCPTGWHVPTHAEWQTLERFIGSASGNGGKLKEQGLAHWQSPNQDATNSTGFTALPGGYRSSTGGFFNLGYNGYFWANTTGTDSAYARYWYLNFDLGWLFNNEDYKVDGYSVRCVKD